MQQTERSFYRKKNEPQKLQSDLKHPKSYPLEHFIGDCCPNDIKSVAEGIVNTLENIVTLYPEKPFLSDRGVPEHDVFARITDDEYKCFYDAVCDAAKIATCFTFGGFLEFISPYIESDIALCDDYALPRDGTGCWHPTFPGRSDDVWMAAATSVKAIENYITSSSQKSLFLVYEQNEENEIFESFHLAIKKEVD